MTGINVGSKMQNNDSLKKLRAELLSPSLSLSYNDPIHIIRGKAQYLFDDKGTKYLDGINNICLLYTSDAADE